MQSIRFDDGFEGFRIQNDPNRVIRFNPADFGIIERFNRAQKELSNMANSLPDDFDIKPDATPIVPEDELDSATATLEATRKFVFEKVDYIFDSPVSEVVFGSQHPLSTVKGKTLFEVFLEAALKVIEQRVQVEMKASQKRVSKYTSQVK